MRRRDALRAVLACDVFLFVCLMPVWYALGCAHLERKPATATVPKRCMHQITVDDDFTKPCLPVKGKPNEGMCDQVHIRFACLDYSNSEK